MRAIWKGFIRFSLVNIPIKLYSATETGATVSFNQLHKEDNGAVGYLKVCKTCESKLSGDDIVKGYEYEPGHYVIIEKEDLENIRLKSTRVIDIEAFVDADEVPHTLFDAPYYAGPDGEVAAKAYQLFGETLRRSNKLAVGRVVLRDREHVVMIAPHGPGILMYKLRYPNELRDIKSVPQLSDAEIDESQMKLAETLVKTMEKPFAELELRDRYNEALIEMIHAKIEGKEVVVAAEEQQPVVDIMTALKESIDMAKAAKKPMKKSKGEEKTSEDKQKKVS